MLAQFRRHASVLLALFTFGCFDYTDVTRTNVAPGHEVQITISPEGRRALANQVGTNVRSMLGRLNGGDSASVTVALARTNLVDGTTAEWNGEQVVVPTRYIDDVQERTLSKGKTVGIIALVTGASLAVALALGRVGSSGGSTVPGSPGK
jgi:hypothetical protein